MEENGFIISDKCDSVRKFVCECRGKPCNKIDSEYKGIKHYHYVEKKMNWLDAR
jgi:hypothetical protein